MSMWGVTMGMWGNNEYVGVTMSRGGNNEYVG